MELKNPIIIQNLFSEKYMNIIEDSCIKSSWSYSNNITYGENCNDIQNGFSNSFDNETIQYHLFQYLIFKSCEKINFKVDKVIRIRKRLTYPNKEKYNIPYQPHTDYNFDHLVLLYYVNDSDGDTYIYKEKNNRKNLINFFKNKKEINNLSILQKINFKRGDVVIFNGKNYHASSLSSKSNRIILNINVSGKFKT